MNQKTTDDLNCDFSGVWTAIATPFGDDGSIDLDCFRLLLSRQEEAGVKGIVVSGTTGEAPALTTDEKLLLVKTARETLRASTRVMAGTGGNNTGASVELSKRAEEAGADSLLIVTPPYNKPSTAGLLAHFKAVADGVTIPLCLYHVPGRTAQTLSVDQVSAICEIDKVTCVKEASADIAFYSRCVLANKVTFLSGDDPTYLASLSIGGSGVISVVSNIFPKEMVELTAAYTKGNHKKALLLHNALLPFIDALFCEVNPCPLKAALKAGGLAKDVVRSPLASVTKESFRHIEKTYKTTLSALKGISGE